MEKDKKTQKKELTPQQREKIKKTAVFAALGLIFCVSMFFIVRGMFSGRETEEETTAGINPDVPQAQTEVLTDDKMKAYEMATDRERENERQANINSLADYFSAQTETAEAFTQDGQPDEINRSVSQYQSAQREIASFYQEPPYDYEKEMLREELEELRERLDRQEESRNSVEEQLALMEKSYEMAARYLPQGNETKVNPFETAVERGMDESLNAHAKAEPKEPTLTVYPDEGSVVSSLYQEVSDSVFMAEQMQERNRSFLSATETADDIPLKNTLKVSVYETVTIKDGENVRLRLLESARVANMLIPKNTLLTAVARIQGNRLSLSVTSIEHRERIIAVNLSAYDLDGQLGILIPNSLEMNAAKEIAAGMGQSAGTSFTFASSAGQQLAADAGRGLLQGASQYFGNKMREVKITLKSGHKLYLMTP
jgi:conjugative transposon TraM protein